MTTNTLDIDIADTSWTPTAEGGGPIRPVPVLPMQRPSTEWGAGYDVIVLADALDELESARSYSEVRRARARLLGLAPLVADAVAQRLQFIQPPEWSSLFEDLLVVGMKPSDAIARARSARGGAERLNWAGVLAAYLQSGQIEQSDVKAFLSTLFEMLNSPETPNRLAAVDAIARVASEFADAATMLHQLAESLDDPLVSGEARAALDEI